MSVDAHVNVNITIACSIHVYDFHIVAKKYRNYITMHRTLVYCCRPNSTAFLFFKYLPQTVRIFLFFFISSLLQLDLQ